MKSVVIESERCFITMLTLMYVSHLFPVKIKLTPLVELPTCPCVVNVINVANRMW
jgi:hypothetical protein